MPDQADVTDKGGTPIGNVGFQQDTYQVDTIAPSVTTFVPTGTSPTTPPSTNQGTVTYQITFREPVAGLARANFQLTTDPTVVGANIVGVGFLIDRTNGAVEFGVPFYACHSMSVESYVPEDCPLCKQGLELVET